MRILIFGESITQGFYDSQGGWAGRLASHYHQAMLKNVLDKKGGHVQVFNLGISGNTATQVLERIKDETATRSEDEHKITIVLAAGAPDAKLRKNIAEYDVYDFQENYEDLVKTAKRLAQNVLCVGLTAADEKLTNPWAFDKSGKQWLNNRLNLFEDTIKQVATNQDISFVPIHDEFLRRLEKGEKLLADGLHPNDAGHELIYNLVQPELEKLLK